MENEGSETMRHTAHSSPATRYSLLATRFLLVLAWAGIAATALAGCDAAARDYPVAIFKPESPQAASIHDLSIILLGIAAVAFLVVEVWLFTAVIRFRNRPENEAVQTHGNLKLETGWTAVTAFVVILVLGMTIKTMADVTATTNSALPMASAFPGDVELVRVVGHQWWWTFEYPQLGVVTANEVHVPVGRTVKLQVESEDVNHSVWVPRLGPKMDTIPGHINYTSFVATQPGVYEGLCAEYCGSQHAHMGFRIVAVSPADFSAWVQSQQAPAARPATEAQREGEQAFMRSCAGCHAVRGTQAQGKMGPDLTHFGSRQSIAANTLQNTPDNLARWLRDPQEVKPENKMPNLKLDQTTTDVLVAYLANLR